MGPGALPSGIFTGLAMNVFLKMVVTAIVAFGVFKILVIPASGPAKSLPAIAIIAVGGPLAFSIGAWILGGLIGAIVGIVLFWLVVTLTLDQFSNVHYDQSQAYTGEIVIISVILWIIIGVVISGIQAMR
jgi:hypothetical protein